MAALREATRLLAVHPVVSLAMGSALIMSLGAVCCFGLGIIAAPWLLCELMALVLGTAIGRRVPRHAGWLAAGSVQAIAVIVVSAAAGAAITWLGTQLPLAADRPQPIHPDNLQMLVLAFGGGAVGLLYMAPYIYTPVLLIDRGGALGGGLVESARLVFREGTFSHIALTFVSHLLQVAPVVLAATIALAVSDSAAVPIAVAASLPAMALTVPLGQAMIVTGYVAGRPREDRLPPFTRPVRWPLASTLAIVGIAPALALLLIAASVITRPSHPRPGSAPLGELVAAGRVTKGGRDLPIPHTALEVRVSPKRLAIVAGDGGGAGRVPRPAGAVFERVRVVRLRDVYAVEVAGRGKSWVTWIDRAGVRLDDGLAVRLADHLPGWGLPLLGLVMLAMAFVLAPRAAALSDPSPRSLRGAWIAALGLSPFAITMVVLGARALFG